MRTCNAIIGRVTHIVEGFSGVEFFGVNNCERSVISFEDIPGDEDYTDAYFGRVAHIVEGFSGVEHFTIGYEQITAIFEDSGVGSVKGMTMFDFLW